MKTLEEAMLFVVEKLQNAGYKSGYIGGARRNRELGIAIHDYDIVTDATPDQVEALFQNEAKPEIGKMKPFGITLVVHDGHEFEVATFRSESDYKDNRHPSTVEFPVSLEKDQARRDFTMNQIFIDPISGEIIDTFGGLEDIEKRIIRFIGDPVERILEDPLRIMRAARFESTLPGFTLSPDTIQAISLYPDKLRLISNERIRDEFMKGLVGDAVKFMERLKQTGMLMYICPDLLPMTTTDQNPRFHPEGNVWVHTMGVLSNLPEQDPILRLAGLLHDVGKPGTSTKDFKCNGHDVIGAEIARAWMKEMCFSTRDIDDVVTLVGNHMRVSHLPEMGNLKVLKESCAPTFARQLALLRADVASTFRDPTEHLNDIASRVQKAQEVSGSLDVPKPVLDGKEVMRVLGIREGKQVGILLKSLVEAQVSGVIRTPEQAREFLRNL